jgi:ribulose-5-phosphate 4-epimerase/fuculose-1-phosphate aldolase
VRDPDGRGAWLKAATWGLEEVTADRVHLVSPDGEVVAGDGPRHSEYPIHTEIMNARPDVGAVVHTHPPYAVALAAELGPARAIFLVNHGIVTVGPDLQTATVAAVLLERACAQQMLTQAFGGWPTWSDHDESLSKRRNIYAEAPVRAVWEYLVRSLG